MKPVKITAVILSVAMCMSMIMPSVSVIADETSGPSETQKTEETEKPVTKETEKPKETEKQPPNETEKQEPAETETTESAETEKQEPTQTEEQKPEETEKQIPNETGTDEPKETPEETAVHKETVPAASDKKEPGNGFSGTCGDTVFWTIDDNGTMTISGSGEYTGTDYDNLFRIKNVVFDGNITAITAYAFSPCIHLASITLPESVKSIGIYAFSSCQVLRSINIPSGIIKIREGTFYHCYGLSKITIPVSVKTIDKDAFTSCNCLTDVYYDGTTSDWNKITVGDGNSCLLNARIHCKDTVYSLSLDHIYYGKATLSKTSAKAGDEIEVSVTPNDGYVLDYIKVNDSEITGTKFTMPSQNTKVYVYFKPEVSTNKCGDNLTWSMDDNGTLTISGSGKMKDYYNIQNGQDWTPWKEYKGKIKSVVFSGDVTSIGNYAFKGCNSLTSIIIPQSIRSIGYGAFSECTNLTSITIPAGITTISEKAFSGCTGLTSVILPKGLSVIEEKAFQSCTSLKNVTIPVGVVRILDYAFDHCTGLQSVSFPEGLNDIYRYAFNSCISLKKVDIPDSVTHLGWYAFANCSELTSIKLSNHIKAIGFYAFCDCTKLTSVTIPDGITEIGIYSFVGCRSLKTIYLPKSLEIIGHDAFSSCFDLADVYYGGTKSEWDKIENLGDNDLLYNANIHFIGTNSYSIILDSVLNGHASLSKTSASAGENVTITVVPDDGYELSSVKVNDSLIFTSSEYFVSPKSVSFTMPAQNTTIKITFKQISSSVVASGTFGENIKWKLEGYMLTISGSGEMKDQGDYYQPWYFYRNGIKTIVIENGITSAVSFSECSNLTKVVLPNSLKSLDGFNDCISLTSINIPNSVTSIGSFSGCTNLKKIILPNKLTKISNTMFSGCESLTSIVLPKSVRIIESDAFMDCTSLKSITIPSSVIRIEEYAFYGCKNLVKVSGGAGLVIIEQEAFAKCPKLKTFVITSKKLRTLGRETFYGDKSLKTLYIKKTTKLTKSGVKRSLKGSYVKTVKVKRSKIRKYKKYFKKSNSGRKVKVKK